MHYFIAPLAQILNHIFSVFTRVTEKIKGQKFLGSLLRPHKESFASLDFYFRQTASTLIVWESRKIECRPKVQRIYAFHEFKVSSFERVIFGL